jgi:anti-sigma B factor antagonist
VNDILRDHGACSSDALAPAGKMCQYFRLNIMDIQVESRGTRRIVRISGKITFEHCPALASQFEPVLAEGVTEVVLDFKGVPFMDSSGIGEVLRLFKMLRDRNASLLLINPNRKLRSLFSMYRFEKFMKILEEVETGKE